MWTERRWRGSQASHTGRTLDVPLLPPAQRAVASAVTGPRALVGLGTKPSPSLANQPLRGKGGGWETRHCFASVLNPDLFSKPGFPKHGLSACSPGLAPLQETRTLKDYGLALEAIQLKALNCFQA